jgi:hypothetical protein
MENTRKKRDESSKREIGEGNMFIENKMVLNSIQ